MLLRVNRVSAYSVQIFMAGDITQAKAICRDYCDEVGLCVTVTPTDYVFRGGEESGFIVGLINYARFPSEEAEIFAKAGKLARKLLEGLDQGSYTIQNGEYSFFVSRRSYDVLNNELGELLFIP